MAGREGLPERGGPGGRGSLEPAPTRDRPVEGQQQKGSTGYKLVADFWFWFWFTVFIFALVANSEETDDFR